jgi:predicted nucleic acid-binding protein
MTIFNATALLDTNVLVYAADEASPFHHRSRDLMDRGLSGQISLCVCPQVLIEFFAIITDSRRVENPREPEEAVEEIEKYLLSKNILKIYPKEDTLQRALRLLVVSIIREEYI